MTEKLSAQFYPSGSSACFHAELCIISAGLFSIHCECFEEDPEFALEDCVINPKLGSIPREIAIKDIGLLVIESNQSVDDWLDVSSNTSINRFEKNRKAVFASIIAVPLSIFLLFKYAVPYLAIVFAAWVPDGAVKLASNHTMMAIEKVLLEPSTLDHNFEKILIDDWQSLISQLDLEHDEYSIRFYRAPKMGPNAFALPDGTIVFTQELVELFNQDRELLTAVLLHEIGHVEHQHSMRLIAETLITSITISYFFGDVSGLFEFFGGAVSTVANNQFTQELEWEADNFALAQLPTIGLSADAFAKAMEKFAEEYNQGDGKLQELLSSHPLIKQRIENALEQKLEQDSSN